MINLKSSSTLAKLSLISSVCHKQEKDSKLSLHISMSNEVIILAGDLALRSLMPLSCVTLLQVLGRFEHYWISKQQNQFLINRHFLKSTKQLHVFCRIMDITIYQLLLFLHEMKLQSLLYPRGHRKKHTYLTNYLNKYSVVIFIYSQRNNLFLRFAEYSQILLNSTTTLGSCITKSYFRKREYRVTSALPIVIQAQEGMHEDFVSIGDLVRCSELLTK